MVYKYDATTMQAKAEKFEANLVQREREGERQRRREFQLLKYRSKAESMTQALTVTVKRTQEDSEFPPLSVQTRPETETIKNLRKSNKVQYQSRKSNQ